MQSDFEVIESLINSSTQKQAADNLGVSRQMLIQTIKSKHFQKTLSDLSSLIEKLSNNSQQTAKRKSIEYLVGILTNDDDVFGYTSTDKIRAAETLLNMKL